jgi:hypothetical protein
MQWQPGILITRQSTTARVAPVEGRLEHPHNPSAATSLPYPSRRAFTGGCRRAKLLRPMAVPSVRSRRPATDLADVEDLDCTRGGSRQCFRVPLRHDGGVCRGWPTLGGEVCYHECCERPSIDDTCNVLFVGSPVLGPCLTSCRCGYNPARYRQSNGSGAALVDDEVHRVVGPMHMLIDGFMMWQIQVKTLVTGLAGAGDGDVCS